MRATPFMRATHRLLFRPARYFHSAALAGNRMFVFGGLSGGNMGDCIQLSLERLPFTSRKMISSEQRGRTGSLSSTNATTTTTPTATTTTTTTTIPSVTASPPMASPTSSFVPVENTLDPQLLSENSSDSLRSRSPLAKVLPVRGCCVARAR